MSEEACEPVLPPEEMIMGTKSASTTALAISSSKKAMAVAVKPSPSSSATSQPVRLRTISHRLLWL